jgi:hypothetical protein
MPKSDKKQPPSHPSERRRTEASFWTPQEKTDIKQALDDHHAKKFQITDEEFRGNQPSASRLAKDSN